MPTASARRSLRALERCARSFGTDAATQKLALIAALSAARFAAPELLRLHEAISFVRAYPDDARVLAAARAALAGFGARPDTRRARRALTDSGVAGAPIHYPFHWRTARWLASRWPERLRVDWRELDDPGALERALARLLPTAEEVEAGADKRALARRLAALAGPGCTDATFLVRLFESFTRSAAADEPLAPAPLAPELAEHLFESLALPMILEPGPGGPSRSTAELAGAPVAWVAEAPPRARPDLRAALGVAPVSVRRVPPAEADVVIDLAREAMVTRARDLDAIKHGSRDDVRLVDAGDGLAFACIGVLPAQRSLLEALYVFLILKNGVPVGYYQAALLFGCAELNFNVFPTFRGAEAAAIYARGLAMVRALFGADTFAVPPYQLGHENDEALASGAFWFYAKLGFAPPDRARAQLLSRERAALRRDPAHRSSRATLRALADGYLHFHLAAPRDDVAGRFSLDAIAEAVSRAVGARFGPDRAGARAVLAREVAARLGLDPAALGPDERRALDRFAPLVASLDCSDWTPGDHEALGAIVRAKAAPREEDFAARVTAHGPLRRALLALARG